MPSNEHVVKGSFEELVFMDGEMAFYWQLRSV